MQVDKRGEKCYQKLPVLLRTYSDRCVEGQMHVLALILVIKSTLMGTFCVHALPLYFFNSIVTP